jgi:hypothetical protein
MNGGVATRKYGTALVAAAEVECRAGVLPRASASARRRLAFGATAAPEAGSVADLLRTGRVAPRVIAGS